MSTCQAVDTDHSGNVSDVYYGGSNVVGQLCFAHKSTNSWCPKCCQFMRTAEMCYDPNLQTFICCMGDALSSRSVALFSSKLNFALKSDVTVQAATLNSLQQAVSTLQSTSASQQSTIASQQTTINSLKTKLGLS